MHRYLTTFMLTLLFLSTQIAASNHVYTGWFSNAAVDGYDTVAYFTEGKAVKGSDKFKTEHLEVEWYFSSEKHLLLFKGNPEKYMPQYGGHCSWAMAVKKQRAPGSPNAWKIVDNKLYLNYDKSIQKLWFKNIPGFIRDADKNWKEIR